VSASLKHTSKQLKTVKHTIKKQFMRAVFALLPKRYFPTWWMHGVLNLDEYTSFVSAFQ